MASSPENAFEVRIGPRRQVFAIDFRELWQYREVFYLLVWRDLKVKYKQTLLGVFWVVFQPLLATLIFAVIFSRFGRFESDVYPYVLTALSGFTIWMFVNPAVTQASVSLVYHEQLVTKIYFPRLIVPAASVFSGLPDLLLTLPILLAVMFYFGFALRWSMLLFPAAALMVLVVSLSVSILLAALNVRFRDVKFVMPFFLQVWMFASPVFYPSTWLPDYIRPVFAINPLSGTLDLFRHLLLGMELNPVYFGTSVISAILLCGIALLVFRKMEDDFADLL